MTNLTEYLTRLREVEGRASETKRWKPFPTGLIRQYMRGSDVVKAHNHTPFMDVFDAECAYALKHELPTLIKIIEMQNEALEIFLESTTPDGCGGYFWRDDAIVDAVEAVKHSTSRITALLEERK